MDPRELTVIVNTGDDIVMHGLSISPDLDIVTYTLAGLVNPDTGWGFRDETFRALEQLAVYGRPQWFHLGDRDLATHIHRTAMLRAGASLSEVADSIREALGVQARILPMSDQPVPTIIETGEGRLHFQEYLVQRRAEPTVRAISFDGIERARPAPGVLEAMEGASSIVICPSNPLISIGPILAVPGVREALRKRRSTCDRRLSDRRRQITEGAVRSNARAIGARRVGTRSGANVSGHLRNVCDRSRRQRPKRGNRIARHGGRGSPDGHA